MRYKLNKTLLIALAAVGIVGGGLLLTQSASAHEGGHPRGRGVELKAEILGISVDELKSAKGEKTFDELLEEKGLTREEFHEQMKAAITTKWQEEGLSDEEIAERLTKMEERRAKRQEARENGEFPRFRHHKHN